jgi:cytosine/adenosine deaminase-related metal-dependent hydrolase
MSHWPLPVNKQFSLNIEPTFIAHSLRAVPTDQLKRLYAFSVLENLPFHVHLEEQPKEIQDCEEVECCTPSELLLSLLPDVDKRLTAGGSF